MSTETSQNNLVKLQHLAQGPKLFTHEEATLLVDILLAVSKKALQKIEVLNTQLSYYSQLSDKKVQTQNRINQEVQSWSDKIRRLGAEPIGVGQVKIISTQKGHYYWEYPNTHIFLH